MGDIQPDSLHRVIQVAIIGCGVIGQVHAAAVAAVGGAHLRWACDLDPTRCERIQAERRTVAAAEVLADPDVDLVCIGTPHPTHADLVIAALAAGKHVWCEKPLAAHPSDLERMLSAAAAHPDQVASGVFQHRFSPVARRLQELIAEGAFGRIDALELTFACTRDAAYYAADAWRGSWRSEGGGVALNQAIHTLDLGLWLAGAKPSRVITRNMRRRLACIEVETSVQASIACQGGLVAAFSADNDGLSGWHQRIVIAGAGGRVVLGDHHRVQQIEHASPALVSELRALAGQDSDGRPLGGGKVEYGDLHAVQLADVLTAMRSGRPPFVGLADAAPANAVVLACYHSHATGSPVDLPLDPRPYQNPQLPLES